MNIAADALNAAKQAEHLNANAVQLQAVSQCPWCQCVRTLRPIVRTPTYFLLIAVTKNKHCIPIYYLVKHIKYTFIQSSHNFVL